MAARVRFSKGPVLYKPLKFGTAVVQDGEKRCLLGEELHLFAVPNTII